jgi:hypothetical protein
MAVMKWLFFILLFIVSFGCNTKKNRRIIIPQLGKLELRDTVNNVVDETTLQYSLLEDSSILKDYKIQVFDSSVSPQNLFRYSSMDSIDKELNARGRIEILRYSGDTLIPRTRPARNPAFVNLSVSRLQATKILYRIAAEYDGQTFKTSDSSITQKQKNNAVRVLALMSTSFFPANLFKKKNYSYTPSYDDSIQSAYAICDTSQKWKYWKNPCLAFGTAIPITRNIVLTAGHCLKKTGLKDFYLVLGYADTAPGLNHFDFDTSNIYRGIQIIDLADDSTQPNNDYCFILLNKNLPVLGVLINRQNRTGVIEKDYYMVGYPLGIPEKISLGHLLSHDAGKDAYLLYIDSFGGNSGSPVFESKTDSLVGMLNHGENDFLFQPDIDCKSFLFCSTAPCRGEKVESIAALLSKPGIKQYLKK